MEVFKENRRKTDPLTQQMILEIQELRKTVNELLYALLGGGLTDFNKRGIIPMVQEHEMIIKILKENKIIEKASAFDAYSKYITKWIFWMVFTLLGIIGYLLKYIFFK